AALRVEDPRAQILRLPDDRRVTHPKQHTRHLLGDGVEGAAQHPERDRVDLDALACGRAGLAADLVLDDAHAPTSSSSLSGSSPDCSAIAITMFPKRSTCAARPGGMTVVESYCVTIAGPTSRLPALSAARP